jgi:hypothetical protein
MRADCVPTDRGGERVCANPYRRGVGTLARWAVGRGWHGVGTGLARLTPRPTVPIAEKRSALAADFCTSRRAIPTTRQS